MSSIVVSTLVSLLVGALGGYAAFYFRGAGDRRKQIAEALADFYSAAATVYYAAKDYQKESGPNRVAYYTVFDQRYKDFLSSSTLLASLVPPKLRDDVLKIE